MNLIKNFSIIIPIFNESENIVNLYIELNKVLSNYNNFEIIFVNDGSTDDSKKKLEILNKKNTQKFKILNNNKNLGQSYSLYIGIKKSKYQNILTIDGDGQNDPKDIHKLINIYFKTDDIILVGGIRNKRQDNLSKRIASFLANKIRSFILKDNCVDTGCSLKIFNKKTFLSFDYFDGMHRFLPALFKTAKKKIVFVNVNHRPRIYGISKYNNFNRMIKGIKDLIKVYRMIN